MLLFLKKHAANEKNQRRERDLYDDLIRQPLTFFSSRAASNASCQPLGDISQK
jgi:hypothetical protein